jgi:predicted nucleotidyltransferase
VSFARGTQRTCPVAAGRRLKRYVVYPSAEMTTEFINELTTAYPSIRKVWLLGSRANGTWHDGSDWDYLVFDDDIRDMNHLCQTHKKRSDIDLLFVCADGDTALSPWPEPDGHQKKLGLGDAPGGLNWREVSDTEASYMQTKERNPPEFAVDVSVVKAVLVFRRA